MKTYLLILPIALLVTYSQLAVKWRVSSEVYVATDGLLQRLLQMLKDPIILSAYIAAFLASCAWLYIVVKLPLTIAFPIYIGVTFAMVILGGWALLGEDLNGIKLIAVLLIFSGIVLGVSSDV